MPSEERFSEQEQHGIALRHAPLYGLPDVASRHADEPTYIVVLRRRKPQTSSEDNRQDWPYDPQIGYDTLHASE